MMSRLRVIFAFMLLFLNVQSLFCRDVILEFKGAYFLPTNSTFRDQFKGSALYGPELTVQLKNDKNWYAFASIDYYKQKGKFLSIADSTKLKLLPLAIGIKYFVPIRDRANFYLGLGFQPVHVRKKISRAFVVSKNSTWGLGGIGKLGMYINAPCNFVFDFFFDYSFVWANNFYGPTVSRSKSNVNGAIFGAALGYRF